MYTSLSTILSSDRYMKYKLNIYFSINIINTL